MYAIRMAMFLGKLQTNGIQFDQIIPPSSCLVLYTMKWTIQSSSLSLLCVLILVGQLPATSASNQALLCAGAGGLMVGVGAGLGEHSL